MARDIDEDIINLGGGLFEDAHVRAPAPPEPERLTPVIALRAEARRARMASRIVGVVAAVLLVGGLAAARQAARVAGAAARAAAALATPPGAGARAAAPEGAAAAPVVPAPAPPPAVAGAAAAPPRLPRPFEPQARARAPVALPEARAQAPLEALGAPRPFDETAAAVAIAAAARAASRCVSPDEARRTSTVRVVFAGSGRATRATVGGPFAGTATGACIARALEGAHVHAFEGAPVAVTTTIHF